MKKLLLLTVLLVASVLTACSSGGNETGNAETESKKAQDSGKTEQKEENTDKEEGESIGVEKGLLNVEVTLPASFFEGEDIDQAIADAKKEGIGEVIENEDGSLTYKMSKATHKDMMAEMEKSVKDAMEEMKTSGDYTSIKDVKGNNDYTTFTLVVDKEKYENSMDGFAIFGLGMTGMFYQVFDGVDAEKAKVKVNVEDEATGEVFNTSVFPDDMPE